MSGVRGRKRIALEWIRRLAPGYDDRVRLRALPGIYWMLLTLTLGQLGLFVAIGGTMHLPGGLMLASSTGFTAAVLLTSCGLLAVQKRRGCCSTPLMEPR